MSCIPLENEKHHDTLCWLNLMKSVISVPGFGFNHPVQLFDVNPTLTFATDLSKNAHDRRRGGCAPPFDTPPLVRFYMHHSLKSLLDLDWFLESEIIVSGNECGGREIVWL